MNPSEVPLQTIQFYSTADYECSYLPHRRARSQVATPSQAINPDNYSSLMRDGFRRSGNFVYRPYCDSCAECISLRVIVEKFVPGRSQDRAFVQHAGLIVRVMKPYFAAEHYALYLRYQQTKHDGSSMSQDSVMQYSEFLLTSPVNTRLVEFRDAQSNALKIISLMDVLDDGISAVYTFYETTDTASYGTYAVLWQIEQAKRLHLPYVYLGYWIEGAHKMRYKNNFQPNQKLINGNWN